MLWRIRAGVAGSAWQAAASTAAVCATRVLWLWLGVSAVLEGHIIHAGVVYCLSAGLATLFFATISKGNQSAPPSPQR